MTKNIIITNNYYIISGQSDNKRADEGRQYRQASGRRDRETRGRGTREECTRRQGEEEQADEKARNEMRGGRQADGTKGTRGRKTEQKRDRGG